MFFQHRVFTLLALLSCASLDVYAQRMPAQVRTVLANATEWRVYMLDPNATHGEPGPEHGVNSFHGWTMLGSAELPAGRVRTNLLRGLGRAMNTKGHIGAACFMPHHGIRAVHKGDTVDLVICFMCKWVDVYITRRGTKHIRTTLQIESTPQPAFDSVLSEMRRWMSWVSYIRPNK